MSARMQSVKTLATRVVKENLVEPVRSMSVPVESDVWIYRMVVAAVGLVLLTSVIGVIALSMDGKPLPEVLVALVSAALGGLTGLLAPAPRRKP
jgi:hypothetical protein